MGASMQALSSLPVHAVLMALCVLCGLTPNRENGAAVRQGLKQSAFPFVGWRPSDLPLRVKVVSGGTAANVNGSEVTDGSVNFVAAEGGSALVVSQADSIASFRIRRMSVTISGVGARYGAGPSCLLTLTNGQGTRTRSMTVAPGKSCVFDGADLVYGWQLRAEMADGAIPADHTVALIFDGDLVDWLDEEVALSEDADSLIGSLAGGTDAADEVLGKLSGAGLVGVTRKGAIVPGVALTGGRDAATAIVTQAEEGDATDDAVVSATSKVAGKLSSLLGGKGATSAAAVASRTAADLGRSFKGGLNAAMRGRLLRGSKVASGVPLSRFLGQD